MTNQGHQKTELDPFELSFLEQHEEAALEFGYSNTMNGALNSALSESNNSPQMLTTPAEHNDSRDVLLHWTQQPTNTHMASYNQVTSVASRENHQPTASWLHPNLEWSPPAHSLPLRAQSNYQGFLLRSSSRPGTIQIGTGPNAREIVIPLITSSRVDKKERASQEGQRISPNNQHMNLSRKRGRELVRGCNQSCLLANIIDERLNSMVV
ncbi:OLC1v1001321C1 [Oldenlandia corymbosa var. corymbosa]|uniref:OLC1v1001321C1 n=1 Tax=Oldenlandia corymbosa var. corymbosa TaxID=529605 RepID=A0AAV1D8G5_OLDCO|nr:OLC1v1001321C1 [Oldenlandia corymbosa var. corymbosa]